MLDESFLGSPVPVMSGLFDQLRSFAPSVPRFPWPRPYFDALSRMLNEACANRDYALANFILHRRTAGIRRFGAPACLSPGLIPQLVPALPPIQPQIPLPPMTFLPQAEPF